MAEVEGTAVPAWVKKCVTAWRNRLLLYAWQIRVESEKMPDEDPRTQASVQLYPETFTAVLVVSDEVPNEPNEE